MGAKRNISSFTLIVAFLAVALAGVAFLPLLPVKLSPSRTLPGLSVNFGMPGNAARIVEMEATSKLEAMLARLQGIKKIHSYSGNGWGSIYLEFDRHTDIDAIRFEASTIIRQTWPQLPESTTFPVISLERPDDNTMRPFLTYTINAPSTPITIQQYAESNIRPKLSLLSDIYRINIDGATPMEWQLEYDIRQLQLLDIEIDDITNAVQHSFRIEYLGHATLENTDTTQSWIRLSLAPENRINNLDATKIHVTNKHGKIFTLDQLVKVHYKEETPQSYFRINGLNSIYISIFANENANQLDLSNKIKKEMDEIIAQLPTGYHINISYDATDFMQRELSKIYMRTGLTLLFLLLFVFIVTFSFRYLLMIVISLTVNIAIAIGLYYLLKLEIELYSLTGITISLNLIIDNTIVMAEHIRHKGNRNVFMSILAATLTTIGALTIIFFLDEKIRLLLQDFAAVIIINLSISLFIALFFIPSLMEKLKIEKRHGYFKKKRLKKLQKKWIIKFNHFYERMILLFLRRKWICFIVLIFVFGLPVFMLPESIDSEKRIAQSYNNLVKNETYKNKVKPIITKTLGGTMRLFAEKVYEGSYFSQPEETVLTVTATLPNGATLDQMNNLISKMETFLTGYKEIRQFQTTIHNARQAMINIYFHKAYQYGSFPYQLKSHVISKALELGGGSWSVFGLADMGFSNNVYESAGSYQIVMYGYNYDELYFWSEHLKDKLLTFPRIKEVQISSRFSWFKDDYQEFYFDLNKKHLAEQNIRPQELFAIINPVFGRNIHIGTIYRENEVEKIKLASRQSEEYDVWCLLNVPQQIKNRFLKFLTFASISKTQASQEIVKENQQYRLCLQYEYIGAAKQGEKVAKQTIEEFSKMLPMGYSVEKINQTWQWDRKDNKQYLLIFLVLAIIYFIASILFDSLKQPFAIIFIIPVSYIGVFLTFYWFQINFDQGGFAAFILLCGITINSSIYIFSEYNSLRKRNKNTLPLRAYMKAWSIKITPILLTIFSTILGFIPFLIGDNKETFWFPLATGTIGGLIMSLFGIFFYLPLFIIPRKSVK